VFPYQRFFEKVQIHETVTRLGVDTPCWEWTSARHPKTDYGVFWMDGRSHQAHRVLWEYKYGVIPEGLVLLHKCDWPPCTHIDPDMPPEDDHFFLGTTAENNTDRDVKGRHRAMRGTASGMSRLTSDHIREIRLLRDAGRSYNSIAKQFGVSASTISRIMQGKTYTLID